MLALSELRDWLSEQDPELDGRISVGAIDGNEQRYVGVYARRGAAAQRICIGGPEMTAYQHGRVSILVHWTSSPVEAEQKAASIYALLYGLRNTQMGNSRVFLADPGEAPIPVGKESAGICEYVIEADIVYERI